MRDYQGVALCIPVSRDYVRNSSHAAPWFVGRVLRELLTESGLKKSDIDGLAVASFSLAPDSVVTLCEYLGMEPRWLEALPYGGASGLLGIQKAARAIQCGDAEVIACIGGDTSAPGNFKELVADFSTFTRDAGYPYGAAGPNGVFALLSQHFMNTHGVTREDLGRLCVAQRYNANHFTGALLGHKKLKLADYLSAPEIASPLHLFDCVMPCAGGEGLLVMSTERARKLNLATVEIAALGQVFNGYSTDAIQTRTGAAAIASQLYNQAGLGPENLDMVQTYDDYPVMALMQMLDLHVCKQGQVAQFLRDRTTTFDGGDIPHNTCGGQLGVGQAGAAGGFLGLVEAVRQLTVSAVENQVPDARTALVSGYGMVNYDRGLCSAAGIFRAGSK